MWTSVRGRESELLLGASLTHVKPNAVRLDQSLDDLRLPSGHELEGYIIAQQRIPCARTDPSWLIGTTSDGEELTGKLTIPEVSHEMIDGHNEYQVSGSLPFHLLFLTKALYFLVRLLDCQQQLFPIVPPSLLPPRPSRKTRPLPESPRTDSRSTFQFHSRSFR
jgi:hypothetical protein